MLHVLRSIRKDLNLGEQGPGFTDTDIRLYKHRYQEDYDLHHDKQYRECVQNFIQKITGSKPGEQYLDFSNAGINLYEHRYQNGCDLHHNEQYGNCFAKTVPWYFEKYHFETLKPL